ncbi:tRNA (adenosine(37)-N6)-dimethylallyltransferase MiaA [Psychroserpens sp. S379A]|uniref:tRNA (adenosine(37)-N6)-dimethylallyltransferase MiaA n=1 Tax=Psychroserpens sp. S379A TaxID=3415137 RepID=UPI003C7ADA88
MVQNFVINAVVNYIMTNILISIIGPTAIGKTALSIKLAQYFDTEILSADSRQFYKEMSIGTAAPTPTELASAKHHCIHHKSVIDNYTVGDFENEAITILDDIFKSKNIAIMVGGSGLYVDAVTKGLDKFPKVDSSIRLSLNERLNSEGITSLQEQLKILDQKAYNSIAIDNPHRLIRALEICIGTNKPYSSFLTSTNKTRNFKTITIGLTAERTIIYDRINLRVDQMITEGLLDEVKQLESMQDLNALNTVGYKELFRYLNDEWTLEFAISEIKKNTRRFAKRQLTWFKKNTETLWYDYLTEPGVIISDIKKKINA